MPHTEGPNSKGLNIWWSTSIWAAQEVGTCAYGCSFPFMWRGDSWNPLCRMPRAAQQGNCILICPPRSVGVVQLTVVSGICIRPMKPNPLLGFYSAPDETTVGRGAYRLPRYSNITFIMPVFKDVQIIFYWRCIYNKTWCYMVQVCFLSSKCILWSKCGRWLSIYYNMTTDASPLIMAHVFDNTFKLILITLLQLVNCKIIYWSKSGITYYKLNSYLSRGLSCDGDGGSWRHTSWEPLL